MVTAPNLAIDMIKVANPEKVDTSSMREFVIGGASLSVEFLRKLRVLLPGTMVFQGYGQTENCGIVTTFKSNKPADLLRIENKPSSCGRPINGLTCKVWCYSKIFQY